MPSKTPDKTTEPEAVPDPVDGFVVLTDACTIAKTGAFVPAADLAGVNTAALVRAGHLKAEVR